jgi:hypothetical protein
MAVQTSEYSGGGEVMASPHLLSSAGVVLPIVPRLLFVALETRYISPRLSLEESLGGSQLPATLLLNANVRAADLVPGLSLSLTGRNLLFSDTEVPLTAEDASPLTRAPGPPFSVMLAAEYRR